MRRWTTGRAPICRAGPSGIRFAPQHAYCLQACCCSRSPGRRSLRGMQVEKPGRAGRRPAQRKGRHLQCAGQFAFAPQGAWKQSANQERERRPPQTHPRPHLTHLSCIQVTQEGDRLPFLAIRADRDRGLSIRTAPEFSNKRLILQIPIMLGRSRQG